MGAVWGGVDERGTRSSRSETPIRRARSHLRPASRSAVRHPHAHRPCTPAEAAARQPRPRRRLRNRCQLPVPGPRRRVRGTSDRRRVERRDGGHRPCLPAEAGWDNVEIIVSEAATAPLPAPVDGALFFLTHDLVRSPDAVEHVVRTCRPGGPCRGVRPEDGAALELAPQRRDPADREGLCHDLRGVRHAVESPGTRPRGPHRPDPPTRRGVSRPRPSAR